MATQVTADKTTVADHAAKVAEDRTAAETAAQKAQSIADSLPDDYVTAVGKIAENTAEIANVKLTDKELQRRVNALYDIGQGITHRFETDSETAYAKTIPTGAKLMSVKSIGGHSEVIDGEIVSAWVTEVAVGDTAHQIPEAIRNLPGYGWSAGTARNYVDYENKRYVQCVSSVDLGTLDWTSRLSTVDNSIYVFISNDLNANNRGNSGLCSQYDLVTSNIDATIVKKDKFFYYNPLNIAFIDKSYTDATAFKQAMQGVTLYYELANPIVTDISDLIPDDFLRNIEVEAGGSVTFKGGNDSYRIPVPSEEEYIVKLSEIGGTT